MTNSKPRPTHELRLGSVKAAIWRNQSEKSGPWHSVTFSRLYKSGENWKRSENFNRDDLPLLRELSQMAFEWMDAANRNRAMETVEVEPQPEANI